MSTKYACASTSHEDESERAMQRTLLHECLQLGPCRAERHIVQNQVLKSAILETFDKTNRERYFLVLAHSARVEGVNKLLVGNKSDLVSKKVVEYNVAKVIWA